MPSVSPLNYPSSGLPTLMAGQTRIASTARRDVPFIACQQHHAMRRSIVICGIQTQMLWRGAAWTWSHNRTVVEQLTQHRRVIDISGCHKNAQRDSSAVYQHMVFDARFGAIRRIRSGFFFPPPASARRCRRHFAIPIRLNVSHRKGASTGHGFAHRPQRASTRQSGHTRSAMGRTLWATHATDNRPIRRTGWHPAASDQRCVGVRQLRVAGWGESSFSISSHKFF